MDNNAKAIAYCRYFESHLVSRFAATGDGLTEKVDSVANRIAVIDSALPAKLKAVARMRNAVVHEHDFEVQAPDEFFHLCEMVAATLGLRPLRDPYRPTVVHILALAGIVLLLVSIGATWWWGIGLTKRHFTTMELPPGIPVVQSNLLTRTTTLYEPASKTLSIDYETWNASFYGIVASIALFGLASGLSLFSRSARAGQARGAQAATTETFCPRNTRKTRKGNV